jgi:hypothetical protein
MVSPDPMSRMIPILLVIGGASEVGLILMKRSGSGSQVAYYVGIASILLVAIGLVLLTIVLNAGSGRFRSSTAVLTCGFAFQLVYLLVLFYYEHLASPRYVPTVSIADLMLAASYSFWVVGTVPYLMSYGGGMSSGSKVLVAVSGILVAVVGYLVGSYWYKSAVDASYSSLGTAATLVHALAPLAAMFPLAWAALLYHHDHQGRKSVAVAYLYFLIPVGLIALADLIMESSYVWSNGSLPGQYSDAIYLLGCSALVASAASIPLSSLRQSKDRA